MIKNDGFEIFQVGGKIRDEILGLESNDIDFTFVLDDINLTVEEGFQKMEDFLTKEGFKIFLSTPDCFTIRAKFPDNHKFKGLVADFVMARKEVGYIDGTRRPNLVIGTLFDDLQRRDFTVNAIAKDIDGNIIDPFDGITAIKRGILITPLHASITFNDDPLRMLRAIRFSITKKMVFSDDIIEALTSIDNWNKLFILVSIERIREELFKCLEFNTPETLRLLIKLGMVMGDFKGRLDLLDKLFGDRLFLKPTIKP